MGGLAAEINELKTHDHICLIYQTREEQLAAVVPFVQIGLEKGEKCVCIVDENTSEIIENELAKAGGDVERYLTAGALVILTKHEAYLNEGAFEPSEMIKFLTKTISEAKSEGFKALRVTSEMTWVLGLESGNERLAEYENKLNELFQDSDVLGICQYDIEHLDPEIIHQAIYTHPLVIYKGRVWNNFQYLSPDMLLGENKGQLHIDAAFTGMMAANTSQEKLQKTNRMLNLIRACNEIIVRAKEEKQLIDDICHFIVAQGGYKLVWIGFAGHDKEKTVEPVAEVGFEKDYLEKANIVWADTEREREPTGAAIRTGKPVACLDILHDPSCKPWRVEAIKLGYQSSLALPLTVDSKVIGALNIYSQEPFFFDEDEIDLLVELANDVGFGIHSIRTENERIQAEKALHESQAQLIEAQSLSKIGSWSWIIETDTVAWSAEMYTLTGLDENLSPPAYAELSSCYTDQSWNMLQQAVDRAMRLGEPYELELDVVRPDGKIRNTRTLGEAVWDQEGRITRLHGTAQDVTERKQAEEESKSVEKAQTKTLALLQNIYDTAPLGMAFLDTDLRYVRINNTLAEINGIPVKDHIGKTVSEVLPDVAQSVEPLFRRILETKEPVLDTEIEGATPARPGDSRRWLCNYYPVIGSDGDVLGLELIVDEITERKRTEEQIEQLSRFPFENPAPVFRVGKDDKMIYANPASDPLLAEWGTAVDQEAPDFLRDLVAKVLPSGKIEKDIELKHEDKTFSFTVAPVAKDNYANFYGVDINNRKIFEQGLRLSELTLANMNEGVNLVKADTGTIVYTNPKFEQMFGYERDEMLGKNISVVNAPTDKSPEEVVRETKKALEKKNVWRGEVHNIRKDGTLFWSHATVSTFNHPDYGPVVAAIQEDITERKQAEGDIRRNSERLERAQRVARMGFLDWHIKTNEIELSDEVIDLFGLSKDKKLITPDLVVEVVHPDDREFVQKNLEQAVRGEKKYNIDHRILRPDGTILWMQSQGELTRDSEGEPDTLLGTVVDITDRKRAEAQIKLLNEGLEERVRIRTAALETANRDLEAFTYSVSHDLRAPLRAVDGFARIIKQDYQDVLDIEGNRLLDIVMNSALNMGRLIDDLLTFSRSGRKEVKKSSIDSDRVIQSVFDEQNLLEPGRDIFLNKHKLSVVQADPAMIKQVWENLISNAIKFTNKKKRAQIEIGSFERGDQDVFWIKDNGVGFDMKYKDKLFALFERLHTDKDCPGTGVG
ncbi:MAG TPA: PAS domain S-box protein, partial [Actinobacteria bacterium]|nr:PAS domain S-box protein [Actinomycetota bacterium]